jgi:hypothetical protein
MKLRSILWLCTVLVFKSEAQTTTFAEYQKQGDACMKKADYECARKNYEYALRIRENDSYCLTRLKNINEVEMRSKKKRDMDKRRSNDKRTSEQLSFDQAIDKEYAVSEQNRLAQAAQAKERQLNLLAKTNREYLHTNHPDTLDNDRDGVPDVFDLCISQPGEGRYWGCPGSAFPDSPWCQFTNGNVAPNAVVLGKNPEGKKRYLVRAGSGVLGYLDEGSKEAIIGVNPITVNVYDMPNKGLFRWAKPTSELFLAGKTVPRTEVSTTNFIARTFSKKQWWVGVANPDNAQALFFDSVADFQHTNYEVLINDAAPAGIIQVKKHASMAASFVLYVNKTKIPYGMAEVKPGMVEIYAEYNVKRKKTATTPPVKWLVRDKTTYKYVLGKPKNSEPVLVEEMLRGSRALNSLLL